MQLYFNSGVILPEAGEYFEQETIAGGNRAVHADLAVQFARFLHHGIADRVPLTECIPGVAQKMVTGVRQRDTAVITLKQGHAQLTFQALDTAAEGGRAHMAGFAGAAKMKALGEIDELFEQADIHYSIIA